MKNKKMSFPIIMFMIITFFLMSGCAAREETDSSSNMVSEQGIQQKTKIITTYGQQEIGFVESGMGEEDNYCHGNYDEKGSYCGYIMGFFLSHVYQGYIYIKPVEWVTTEDNERLTELGMTEADLPNGYCILDEDQEVIALKITDETEYHFIDGNHDFPDLVVRGKEPGVRCSQTKEEEIFIQYLEMNRDNMTEYPFFFEMQGNNVKYVSQKFLP